MMKMMLRATSSYRISSDVLRTGFIRRIVLPVIEKSMEESTRWVKMFTLKHMPVGQSIHTPIFPVRPGILEELIEYSPDGTPKYILDLYHQFVLTNISPPAGLVELNNKITTTSNSAIPTKASIGCHYTVGEQRFQPLESILCCRSRGLLLRSRMALRSHMSKNWSANMQMRCFRWQMSPLVAGMISCIGSSPQLAGITAIKTRAAWLANGKPVYLRIMQSIDALRTPAW